MLLVTLECLCYFTAWGIQEWLTHTVKLEGVQMVMFEIVSKAGNRDDAAIDEVEVGFHCILSIIGSGIETLKF